ncbi:ATP-binding cassette domain-containing protein, partial [Eggerthella sinensis]|uniref:ATP-binding cassette domain-containing protein n=1 Tax=Eggerthella sinensis TaxID=242230 RepID=UPI0022E1A680
MIQLTQVSKTYGGAAQAHHALRDVNLTIEDGDVFGIIGQSGAGKSTLVRCINLLERPTAGRVLIDGVDVTDVAGKQLLDLRASIGMIFQNFSLFQQRTVLGNVTFPLELAGQKKAAREGAPANCSTWWAGRLRSLPEPAVGRQRAARGHRP